jgi:hypothetical protein
MNLSCPELEFGLLFNRRVEIRRCLRHGPTGTGTELLVRGVKVLGQRESNRRGADEYVHEARGKKAAGSFEDSGAKVPHGCRAQAERHHQDQENRPSRCPLRASAERLSSHGTFLLGEELGYRGQMRNRIFSLVER